MKNLYLLILLSLLIVNNTAFAQLNVNDAIDNNPLGNGSWLRFTTGGSTTNIIENCGLNITGSNIQPVKILNASFLVGYNSSCEDLGYGNALIQGNVGIGTKTPGSRLTIQGEGAESQGAFLFIDNYNNTFGGNASIAGIRTNSGSGDHYNFLKLQNIDGTKFLITGAGNVAIGGAQTYGYKLAVHGTIRAQEIKVEAGPWPDYVFDASYKLPDLKNVESYIKTHKHLPGLPSAIEVKANGIALGETNRSLLQKIEELTLYVIQLKKENEAIKASLGLGVQHRLSLVSKKKSFKPKKP